jgi:branched-chain amino acid transport system substrate-binding protein
MGVMIGIRTFPEKEDRNMQKSASCVLVALTTFALALFFWVDTTAASRSEDDKKPIVLGWTATLSGPMSTTVDVHRVFSKLVDHVNKEEGGIGGHPIKLVVADTESNPTKAVIGAKKLITEDKVHFLIGDRVTGICIPVGLTSFKYKTVHMAIPGAEIFDMKIKQAGPEAYHWNFCTPISNPMYDIGTTSVKLPIKLGKKRVFSMYPETSFGKGMFGAFKKFAEKAGIEIVGTTTYPPDASTFGPQIAAIRKAKPDLIFNQGADYGSAFSIAALREGGITLPIQIYYSLTSPETLQSEKIRKAYLKDPAVYVLGPVGGCWGDLPDDDPRRNKIQGWSNLHEKFFGETIYHSFQADAFAVMQLIKVVWGKMIKDQPDILNKDLDTIRSTVRDHMESTPIPISHGGMVRVTPKDHVGIVSGTGIVAAQFRWPPPYKFIPGCEAVVPPWRR